MKKFILLLFFLGFTGNVFADDVATNILKLKSLNACSDCDLNSANFEGANLQSANLAGSRS